jgi:hypothetical protein
MHIPECFIDVCSYLLYCHVTSLVWSSLCVLLYTLSIHHVVFTNASSTITCDTLKYVAPHSASSVKCRIRCDLSSVSLETLRSVVHAALRCRHSLQFRHLCLSAELSLLRFSYFARLSCAHPCYLSLYPCIHPTPFELFIVRPCGLPIVSPCSRAFTALSFVSLIPYFTVRCCTLLCVSTPLL